MNTLSILALVAGTLELSVPVYGLILIRRFGIRSVGRFLVSAFSALALLHLVRCLQSNTVGLPNSDLVGAFASGLLLIGMGHLQGLHTQRRQSEFAEQKLSANWQATLEDKTANLTGTNQQLLEEIAQYRENHENLRRSEQQYRFIFSESPQPQWIFDLRSLKLLAVNRAALGLFGFTREESMALSVRRLLQPEAVGIFLRDVAGPCPKAQSRGCLPFCTKTGGRIEAEICAVDLNYDGCPARLIVVSPVTERRREPEQLFETRKMGPVSEPRCTIPQALDRTIPPLGSQPKTLVQKSTDPAARLESPKIADGTRSSAATPPVVSLDCRSAPRLEPPTTVAPTARLSKPSRSPAAKQTEVLCAQTTSASPKPASPRRSTPGKKTILLVEPESKARGLARFVLSRQGYRVIETDCSSTVLALWESESSSVDVLLTNVALPEGLSGSALADQLRQTNPELKVVYTSTATSPDDEAVLVDQKAVPKPYTPDKLLEAVQNCLV